LYLWCRINSYVAMSERQNSSFGEQNSDLWTGAAEGYSLTGEAWGTNSFPA
jgi:hypothetical protein